LYRIVSIFVKFSETAHAAVGQETIDNISECYIQSSIEFRVLKLEFRV